MKTREVAFYARVSSEQQTTAQTILSQVAVLRERILEDGLVLLPEHEFLDGFCCEVCFWNIIQSFCFC